MSVGLIPLNFAWSFMPELLKSYEEKKHSSLDYVKALIYNAKNFSYVKSKIIFYLFTLIYTLFFFLENNVQQFKNCLTVRKTHPMCGRI
jgi:hypothetical protein